MDRPVTLNEDDIIKITTCVTGRLLGYLYNLGQYGSNLYAGSSILEYPTIQLEEYILSRLDLGNNYKKK